MTVVSNTSPLSNLSAIGHIELLAQIYGRITIPTAVANELAAAAPEDLGVREVPSLAWIEIRPVANQSLVEYLVSDRQIHIGEAEAIALAVELNAARLIIDERLGRREANRLGIPIVGILGILVAAKNRGLISAVRPLMDELIAQADFRVAPQLYTEILVMAGE